MITVLIAIIVFAIMALTIMALAIMKNHRNFEDLLVG